MSEEIIVQKPENSAVTLIREAINSKADPAYLRELLAVRREWEGDEARKAFNLAVAEFQRRAPIIEKADKAYDKTYARMDRIWREIRPLLTELGLSVTWQICELKDEVCHVEGQLRHKDGHGERLVQDLPVPEIKGANKAQQVGSASTYAKRYAMCSALGIVTGDDDDDGNAAASKFLTKEQADTISELIQACRGLSSFDEPKFWDYVKVDSKSANDIMADKYASVEAMLRNKLKGAK